MLEKVWPKGRGGAAEPETETEPKAEPGGRRDGMEPTALLLLERRYGYLMQAIETVLLRYTLAAFSRS